MAISETVPPEDPSADDPAAASDRSEAGADHPEVSAGDGCLKASEFDGCSTDEIVDALGQLSGLENAARLQELRLVLAVRDSEEWKQDGAANLAAWLTLRLRCSYSTAAELERVAVAADRLPAITAAFGDGLLSWEQLRILIRFATPENDAELARAAQSWTVSATERAARLARDKAEREAREEHRNRYARFRWNRRTEMLELHARLSDTGGAVVARVLTYLAGGMGPNPETGEYDSFEQLCADALVELASLRLGSSLDSDRATVVVHAEADVILGDRGSGLIEDGSPICPETVRRLLCDCHVEISLEDPETGKVIGIGRRSRKWPRWLYRAIRDRDGGCAFPGCDRRAWTHIHHIWHWTKGGPTDMGNGVLVCPTHHRLVHEGGWTLTGNPDAPGDLVFRDPDGREFRAQRVPLRAEVRNRFGVNWNLVDPPWWPWREGLDPMAEPWDVPFPDRKSDPEPEQPATGDEPSADSPVDPPPRT